MRVQFVTEREQAIRPCLKTRLNVWILASVMSSCSFLVNMRCHCDFVTLKKIALSECLCPIQTVITSARSHGFVPDAQ